MNYVLDHPVFFVGLLVLSNVLFFGGLVLITTAARRETRWSNRRRALRALEATWRR